MTDLSDLTELERIQREEINHLEKRLARVEKYSNTLKHHIKAVASKNTLLREETVASIKKMNLSEKLYLQLKRDHDTDTNHRLQKKVKYLNEIIEQQRGKIESHKNHNMYQAEVHQETKKRLNHRNLEVSELRTTSSKLRKDVKSLTYITPEV